MCNNHLTNYYSVNVFRRKTGRSEFTSWAGSISIAIRALSYRQHEEARISVIDTRRFPNQGIYHIPSLYDAGFADDMYDHEYFVHGIVKGGPNSGYRSVLWSELVAKGIGTLIPLDGGFGHMPHLVPESGTE